MLKFIFFLFSFLFLLGIRRGNKMYWFIQNCVFFTSLLFILIIVPSFYSRSLIFFIYIDILSYGIILLRLWICSLMFLASEKIFFIKNYYYWFIFFLILLLLFLFLSFSVRRLLIFYLFFERRLIPTLFLILGWGYQPERIQAGLYLLFYTLLASLPLLGGIFFIYLNFGSLNYYMFLSLINNIFINNYFYLIIVTAFVVKMPIFLVHLWLPKAHVEAPISGSIILAGVLLKLGGYGLLRVFLFLGSLNKRFNFILIRIRLVGGVLIRLNCLRQVDFKSLIAYSSVAHIGLVLGGLLTLSCWGINRSYTIIIAHGVCSSGMFCLANISYERLLRRSLLINKGLLNLIPRLTLWWFLLRSSNISAPPTLNLLGEIGLLNRIVSWSWLTVGLLIFLSFFRAAYCLYLYSYRQHGLLYSGVFRYSRGFSREFLLLFLHWIPLNLFILNRRILIIWV